MEQTTVRILGIDPGSRTTGFGIIDAKSNHFVYIDSGCIRTGNGSHPERLGVIFAEVGRLISLYAPAAFAIEQVFMHRNPDSALKLGQARGAAICAAVHNKLSVSEYTPAEIKQALVGKGNAQKSQVQHMVTAILELSASPQSDAADALAVAICHIHTQQNLLLLQQSNITVRGRRRGRYR